MIFHVTAFALGFVLDLLFGDPLGAFHIVVAIGKLISLLEKCIRAVFPKSKKGELLGGAAVVVLVCLISVTASMAVTGVGYKIHWIFGLAAETFLCWQCLAARDLYTESMAVYRELKKGDIPSAQTAVGRIVGRDTNELDARAISRACVETIAENCSDGVVAPMLFLALGGAPLGVLYKAINTMDSMLGYKNDRYLYFGRAAAKLDDGANFIPARIAALFMTAAAFICGADGKNAWRIFCRDRYNHSSPNSANTEAVCAGALHIRLGGTSKYFGKAVEKPYIGDDDRNTETEDILRANCLMLVCSLVLFAVCVLLKAVVWIC